MHRLRAHPGPQPEPARRPPAGKAAPDEHRSGATARPIVTGRAATSARLHAALVENGLVAWTSGNVSARVPGAGPGGADLMVIKPSGVATTT